MLTVTEREREHTRARSLVPSMIRMDKAWEKKWMKKEFLIRKNHGKFHENGKQHNFLHILRILWKIFYSTSRRI